MSNAKEQPKEELVDVTVARGRTVVTGVGPKHEHGPGAKLKLAKSEAERLMEHGALVDPQAAEIARGIGPDFNVISPK